MSLKLGPIPDRTPVKLSLSLAPDVHAALIDYAAVHAREYGKESHLSELAVLMIEEILNGDTAFKRARKSLRILESSKE